MIAAHPSVLDQERRQLEDDLKDIIGKISPYLNDHELALLCWAASIQLVRMH